MGQSVACSYWNGSECNQPQVKDVQADLSTAEYKSSEPEKPSFRSAVKPSSELRAAFRPPSEMLKTLKAQENKKMAQERWAKTKAEWEARVTAELEERERSNQQPGTEPDRYHADERQRALQAIREEEELKTAEADGRVPEFKNAAEDLQVKAAQEDAKSLDTPEATMPELEVPEVVQEEREQRLDRDIVEEKEQQQQQPDQDMCLAQEQQQQPDQDMCLAEDKSEQRLAQEAAERKSLLDDFLAKNGFDGVSNKRRRTLRPSIYPLHLAAEKGDAQLIGLLLEAGADRLMKDSRGQTPEEVARKKNRKGSHDEALAALSSLSS